MQFHDPKYSFNAVITFFPQTNMSLLVSLGHFVCHVTQLLSLHERMDFQALVSE